MAGKTVGPISAPLPVPRWALPPSAPAPSPIDFSKLLDKLLPPPDGEDMARMRTGVVSTVNADGTVDVGISGLVVPGVARLTNAPMVAGSIVNIIIWRGGILVIGTTASGPAALVPISTHAQAATADITAPTTSGTGAAIAITGCAFNFTTTVANAVLMADLAVDWDPQAVTNAGYAAFLRLDGVDTFTPALIFEIGGNTRIMTSRQFRVPVATAGAHNISARVQKFAGGGGTDLDILASHTVLSGVVYQPA